MVEDEYVIILMNLMLVFVVKGSKFHFWDIEAVYTHAWDASKFHMPIGQGLDASNAGITIDMKSFWRKNWFPHAVLRTKRLEGLEISSYQWLYKAAEELCAFDIIALVMPVFAKLRSGKEPKRQIW